MSRVRRRKQVRGLMDAHAFTQRILDRLTSVLGSNQHDGVTTVYLASQGYIHPANLKGAYVVIIGHSESFAARVESVASADGVCRLKLGPWCDFINHDPTRPPLGQGIHLWLGAAWRLVPLSRAA